jgi:hypothetical protein
MTRTKLTPAQRKTRATRRTAGAAFYLGAAASLAANVYASQHSFVGVATGLWSPLAAIVALELAERVPAKGKVGKGIKISVGFLALAAAYTSYWHIVHVFAVAGSDAVTRYAGPLTVDVLMGLARVAMLHKPAASHPSTARRTAKAPAAKPRSLKAV